MLYLLGDAELEVHYEVFGTWMPATLECPAESPEVEDVIVEYNGRDITDKINAKYYKMILDACYKDLDENRY